MEQRTEEWLQIKRGKVSSSKVSVITTGNYGLTEAQQKKFNDYEKRVAGNGKPLTENQSKEFNKFCIKLTDPFGDGAKTYAKQILSETIQEFFEDEYTSHSMQDGIDLEQSANDRYEQETLNTTHEVAWVEYKDNKQGSSPDRLVGEDGMVEFKCVKSPQHMTNLLATECPAEYYDQIQHQMYITGRKWNDFVSYNPYFKTEHQIKIIRVLPSPEWVELYEERYVEFLELVESYRAML